MRKVLFLLFISFSLKAFSQIAFDTDSIECKFPLVEIAHFPGGQTAFHKFLNSNMNIPQCDTVLGKIVVSFTIDTLGAVKDVEMKKGGCKPLNDEVVRVIRGMPNWVYDVQPAHPIEQKWMLPIYLHPQ